MKRRDFLTVAAGAPLLLEACATHRPVTFAAAPRRAPLLIGINAAFYGSPLWPEDYAQLAAWSARGVIVRTPVRTRDEAISAIEFMRPYPGLLPLLLVERPNAPLVFQLAVLPFEPWGIEIVNEPNLDTTGFTAMTPQAFGAFVRDSREVLRGGGFGGRIVSGGIWQVTEEDLRDFLVPAMAVWEATSDDVCVGLHWYGDSRDDVKALVQQYLGTGRPLLVTEFGQASRTAAEDTAQAAYVDEQLAAFTAVGNVIGATVYQLASAPGPTDLANFGLQRVGRTWKPAATVMANWGHR